jgi:hypothetical protein
MKTIKGITTIVLLIFSHSFCYAQQDVPSAEQCLFSHKGQIKDTAYIFEGTVIKQKHFKARNNEFMTCNIISIAKIYKGSPKIKLGTIKVIVSDGRYESNGFVMNVADGGGYSLGDKGSTYILFTRLADSYMLVDSAGTVDNMSILTTYGCDYPVVISDKDSANWYGTPQFKTLDDIETFFKENGLTVQEEVK